MIGRAEAKEAATSDHPRWLMPAVLAGFGGLIAASAFGIAPYVFEPATLEREMASQIRATTGLVLDAKGPARFGLFPQPHLSMAGVHLADPSRSLTIDADAFLGEVRFFPLLTGRLEITSATLIHPRLDVDLDGGPIPSDSTIGQALHAAPGLPDGPNQRLGIVTLSDGSATIGNRATAGRVAVSHINVTVDWRNLNAPAALTGTVEFQGETAEVAAWIGLPSSLMRGDRSPLALHIQSAALNLSANGTLESTPPLRYRGHISVEAPSLPAVMTLGGYKMPLPAPFANLSLAGDATIGGGAMDLQNLRLRLDGNDYEGTLAYQDKGETSALSGTLATEQLSLAPFSDNMPQLLDSNRHWSTDRLKIDPRDQLDLDLRISATHLRAPPLIIDDAALAVITRDQRTEVALVAGKAYGGTIKGRASIGLSESGLSLRATGSLGEADLSALSWDLMGRQRASGTVSASGNLETNGANARELVTGLHGWIKAHAANGELSDVDIGHGLREIARKRPDTVLSALRNGRTPFKTLALGANISGGEVTIDEGLIQGPDVDIAVEGKAGLDARALDFHATATVPGPPADPDALAPRLSFEIKGTFDQPDISPDFGTTPAR
ncbi:MAG: AsmA family protein [Beijerinckiaceae bacterium]|nr:AsmA family protein [Beijerinckiaceae bacterium]